LLAILEVLMIDQITVAWFSAGVSSAVATKLMIEQVDKVIYQHIDDQDQDTLRFVRDCETWFGKPIEIRQSPYRCVNNACRGMGFVNGPYGATCSRLLKRRDRQEWEAEHRFFCTFRYVWGMDADETRRADRLRDDMREDEHAFPLIERGLTKQDAHGILREARIARPRMYDMGYPNNNCRGCVKGARGYWNKVRVDMPDVFRERAAMERAIGGTCINGVYLDELDPSEGRDCKIILPECGAMCEAALQSIANPSLTGGTSGRGGVGNEKRRAE
jgi:hypothetical protein